MADVINYWPDPQFRTTVGDVPFVAANLFPNPSPTLNLDGWAAVSGGSITRTTAAKLYPENTYGCRVVNGVTLTGANTMQPGSDYNFTGKIKAVEAMTITISAAMETPGQTIVVREVGWGDFGWGKELTYVSGATKTFAAGEECLFRIYCGEQTNVVGPVHKILVTLSGTGTFDLDGISQWLGVGDGAGDDNYNIPDMFPYFSGDTPDDGNFSYEWYGEPYASSSLQKAKKPKYAYSAYDYIFNDELPLVPDQAFSVIKGGEHRLAVRSQIMFGAHGAWLYDGVIPDTIPVGTRAYTNLGIDLPAGKNYCITYDVVSDYQNYYYGYAEPQWGGGLYPYVYESYPGNTYETAPDRSWPSNLAYISVAGHSPYRQKVMLPFPAPSGDDAKILPNLDVNLDWVTGDVYITNVGIFEIGAILHRYDYLPDNPECTWDLTAMGIVPGTKYHANVEYDRANSKPAFEYRVGTGAWTTLVASTLETVSPEEIYAESFDFTVPTDATEVRFRLTGNLAVDQWGGMNSINTFDLFEAPPEFFDGDTPDGNGYAYSWTGTPYDSPSVRTEAAAPAAINAKVFVGGTAVAVSEARVVQGGTLTPVSEIGI